MSDINIVIKLEAEKAIRNTDKLKDGLDKTGKSANKLAVNIKNTTSAFKVFAGNIAALGVKAAITGVVQLTKAISALGIETVQAASDAEETLNKFNVVFGDVSESADKMAADIANSYGLAKVETKDLLASTGDLLTGFGFTGESALDLSGQVQKLAVDLASFTNFSGGAKGASEALTKALLGERESVKSLGISILEEDVKRQVAINSAKGMTFATERQAKAQATLDIALKQSKNAIGDFARSQASYANQTRILNARISDLKVAIGSQLLPVVSAVTSKIIEFVKSIDEKRIQSFVQRGIQFLVAGLKEVVTWINPVITYLKMLGNVVSIVNNTIQIAVGSIMSVVTQAQAVMVSFIATIVNSIPARFLPEGIKEEFETLQNGLTSAADATQYLSTSIQSGVLDDVNELTEAVKGLGEASDETINTEAAIAGIDSIVSAKQAQTIAIKKEDDKQSADKDKKVKTDQKNEIVAKKVELKSTIDFGNAKQVYEQSTDKERLQRTKGTLGSIATLTTSGNKELAAIGKAAAISTATIDGISAVQKALASAPPPFNFILAGLVGTATAANVAKIASHNPSFEDGGIVPGQSFTGDNVQANVNSGEMILNRSQQSELFGLANGAGGSSNQEIVVYTTVELDGDAVGKSVSRQVADGLVLGENI